MAYAKAGLSDGLRLSMSCSCRAGAPADAVKYSGVATATKVWRKFLHMTTASGRGSAHVVNGERSLFKIVVERKEDNFITGRDVDTYHQTGNPDTSQLGANVVPHPDAATPDPLTHRQLQEEQGDADEE